MWLQRNKYDVAVSSQVCDIIKVFDMDITIIIPTLNESRRLFKCLSSIRDQCCPDFIVHIIVVDDYSSDNTVDIAESFGAQIITSGYRDIEKSKFIGLQYVSTSLVCFMDADNYFPTINWLQDTRRALLSHPDAVGAQSAWFVHSPTDSIANRYCSLMGCMDPAIYYLCARDRLAHSEGEWRLGSSTTVGHDNYWLVQLSLSNIRTFGSQAFLTYTIYCHQSASQERFYHIDYIYSRCVSGTASIVILKNTIGHDGCSGIRNLLGKLYRNITLYNNATDRLFKYNLSWNRQLRTGLILLTILKPLYDSIRHFYIGPRDVAYLVHGYISFCVGVMYTLVVIRTSVKQLFASLPFR